MPREMYPGSIILLFSITWTVIVTIAYAKGLFNSFLNAAVAIISCAFDVLFGRVFLGWISRTRDAIALRVTNPIHAHIQKIPRGFKATFYTLLGYGILVFDLRYNTIIFAEDETKFYDFLIYGHTYWFTELALLYGGGLLAFGILYFLDLLSEAFFALIDKRIRIFVVMRK